MKLRNRRKRVQGSIKQEDHKPVLAIMPEPSTTAATDTDSVNPTIKQEDTKEQKALLKQDGKEKDYYHCCDLCETRMADLKSVLEHRTSIHINNRFNKPKIKNIDMEPDIHDLNLYCKPCERSYKDIQVYRQHLRQVHFMVLKSMPRCKPPPNDTVPDPNDPNLHCRACDHTYTRKDSYKAHCRYAHGMKHVKFANQSSVSNSTTDSYCQACDTRFASMDSYRRHLFTAHKVDWRTIRRKRRNITPDANDPNFYCRSCEKKMASKANFKRHLKLLHSIFQSAPRKESTLRPDPDDPNNYCRACQKTYSSRSKYRSHLRLVHQMTLPLLKSNINRTNLPDPYNADHYCRVCKKTYKSLTIYRKHCRRVHFMTLNHASIVNPAAKININDPGLYCAQCERTLPTKVSFKKHLKAVHDSV